MFKYLITTIHLIFFASVAMAAEKAPNIILVMADDQGYGDTGFTGHTVVKTPNLDAMAKAGVVFNRFYAAAPVCSPTRASVMTGRHPFRTNVPNHGHYMRPDEITIAERLKSAGYVTGHFGKWHIGSVQAESPTSPGKCGFDEWLSGLNFFDKDPYLSRNGTFLQIKGQGSVITMDATLDFLKKHYLSDKPMFAVTWFPSPHVPHSEIADKGLYKGEKNRGYFQEITLLDAQLGRLRKSLRDLKIEQNTIVWYCSDNGGLVKASSGGREKKGSVYEGGLRVPCIIEWPSKWQPKTIDTPSSTSDIYPTLLDVVKVSQTNQPPLDGVSLLDAINGKTIKHPAIGFWHGHTHGQSTFSDRFIKKMMEAQQAGEPSPFPGRLLKNVKEFPVFKEDDHYFGHAAWLDWPWKLHRIQSRQHPKNIKWELYHLVNDPMEKNPIDNAEKMKAMQKELTQWQRSVLDSWSGKDYTKK